MVNIHIFHSVSAREQLAGEKLSLEANDPGIYFHNCKNSSIPFYIGRSDHMADRNKDHLAN